MSYPATYVIIYNSFFLSIVALVMLTGVSVERHEHIGCYKILLLLCAHFYILEESFYLHVTDAVLIDFPHFS